MKGMDTRNSDKIADYFWPDSAILSGRKISKNKMCQNVLKCRKIYVEMIKTIKKHHFGGAKFSDYEP